MPYFMNLIGDRGGGKTTFAVHDQCQVHQEFPWAPCVTNIETRFDDGTKAIYKNDILKWLAVKTILASNRDPDKQKAGRLYANVNLDEAAIQGLESRGSASRGSVPNTYLLALSRKIRIDIKLLTQLMSMIDKRGQWISDYDILCEASAAKYYIDGVEYPVQFNYRIYKNLKLINLKHINGEFAREWLYPKFDTDDVPLTQSMLEDFIDFYEIKPDDYTDYRRDMGVLP
jgi:hypothetical protein